MGLEIRVLIILAIVSLFLLVSCAAPKESEEIPVEPVIQEESVEEKEIVTINETPEKVEVVEPPKPEVVEKPAVKEFVVEGDDKGLYPDKMVVKKGDQVKITFKARSQGTYHGGLDFRSPAWGDTGKVLAGESTIVEFTAEETVDFKSYWPSTGVLKATGEVVVE